MAKITPVEDKGNHSELLLMTGKSVVMSDTVTSAAKDLESDTMPLPDGVWRDGLFGCFNNCYCSPVFWLWLGWCCNPSKLRSCSLVSKPVSSFLAENDTCIALIARIIT